MSMHEYPMVEASALLIDYELATYINLYLDKKNDCVPEEIQEILKDETFAVLAKEGSMPCDYHDCELFEDVVTHASSFTGEANAIGGDAFYSFDDDRLFYIPGKELQLFEAAYKNKDEMLEFFKESLNTVFEGILLELPEDFDWWAHIVDISGTIYC